MCKELTRAENRIVGFKQVLKSANAGELDCIYIAQDADRAMRQELLEAARKNNVAHVMVKSRKELGNLCGIEVPAATAALTKTTIDS